MSDTQLTSFVDYNESFEAFKRNRELVERCMGTVLVPEKHYDTIPGCGTKPALLKAGAEVLCSVFNMSPEFDVKITELQNGHREYTVTCNLWSFDKQRFFGSGIGSCSTLEKKYRWRSGFEPTGELVPDAYKYEKNPEKKQELLGGKGNYAKLIDGQWMICTKVEKTENEDIADQYNTILKMAKKRALVDAVLTRCAASDIFTQDLEELKKEYKDYKPHEPEHPTQPQQPAKPVQPEQKPMTDEAALDELVQILSSRMSMLDAHGIGVDYMLESGLTDKTALANAVKTWIPKNIQAAYRKALDNPDHFVIEFIKFSKK